MTKQTKPMLKGDELKQAIQEQAKLMGLGTVAITHSAPAQTLKQFEDWVDNEYHGEMGYLARPDRFDRRRDLNVILSEVRSLIILTLPYWPNQFPKAHQDPLHGVVSCYAWGKDYHKILGKNLKKLCKWLEEHTDSKTRWYTDTGAIQERDLAARAGIGFVGKNTMLIDPRYGSGFFIAEILTTAELPPDLPRKMPSCGSCSKCLDACPTDAFVAPYVMDARKCISYLTIELKGSIPIEYRPLIGNLIYGCDICQQVCPWMSFAGDEESPLWGSPPEEVTAPKLYDLLELDEEAFKKRFEFSPIKRIKRAKLLRNVAVAIGNTGLASAIPILKRHLDDPEPLIREHVQWAIEQLEKNVNEGLTPSVII